MLQVLVDISLKCFVAVKRHGAMQKLEKRKKEREKIDTKMSRVFKTMGT